MNGSQHHRSPHPKGYLDQLENSLYFYFVKKAPALPEGGREFIVMIAPWLVIVGAFFSIPTVLAIFGYGGVMSGLPAVIFGPGYIMKIILTAVRIFLELMALRGLFARKKKGWDFIFYAVLVNGGYYLVSMNLAGLVIGMLLSFYLLFQVREYYK
jgi:hypothetical protein